MLEDPLVDLSRPLLFPGHTHHREHICEALDTETDGAVAHVRLQGLRSGIIVNINDTIQVPHNDLGDLTELGVVEQLSPLVYKRRQRDRGQITNRSLVWCGIFKDLCA